MLTSGSETSQYREEKKPIGISLVAASENESSPNRRVSQTIQFILSGTRNSRGRKALLSGSTRKKLQIVLLAEAAGKQHPRR